MRISEMQDKLEELQSKASITYETANAISTSLDTKVLTVEQVGFALVGVVSSMKEIADEIGNVIEETIDMQRRLEEL